MQNEIGKAKKNSGKWQAFIWREKIKIFFQVLSDQSKFEQADGLYEEAEKVDPENANLLVHRGLIQLQWKGDIVKAVEFITQ